MTRIEGPKETLVRQLPYVLATLEEGKIYTLEIKRYYKPRTLNQNSLFHALIGLYSRRTGSDFEYVKDGIKEKYGEKVRVKIGNTVQEIAKPSSKCNTFEFCRLIDGIILECCDEGIDTTEYDSDVETIRGGGENDIGGHKL